MLLELLILVSFVAALGWAWRMKGRPWKKIFPVVYTWIWILFALGTLDTVTRAYLFYLQGQTPTTLQSITLYTWPALGAALGLGIVLTLYALEDDPPLGIPGLLSQLVGVAAVPAVVGAVSHVGFRVLLDDPVWLSLAEAAAVSGCSGLILAAVFSLGMAGR